ncbi:hypothetical protein RB595_000455 [Gaeumannomyces hyphopodioides]
MRFSSIFTLFLTAALSVEAYPSAAASSEELSVRADDDHSWKAPGPNDLRGPCPMVNTLANHGYLPRDGRKLNLINLIKGLDAGVNLDAAATTLVGAVALTTGNLLWFNLDDLNKHGIIEHDGSLSRNDVALGDNHSFNAAIWATTAARFPAGNGTIDIATAAAARKARLAEAKAANPKFDLGLLGEQFSQIETALYLSVFGNTDTGDARSDWVKILFQEERLPLAEGWTRPANKITISGLSSLRNKINAAA